MASTVVDNLLKSAVFITGNKMEWNINHYLFLLNYYLYSILYWLI